MDNSLLVDLLIEDFGDGVKYGWYAIVFLSMCSVETKKLNHMASGSFYVRKAERPRHHVLALPPNTAVHLIGCRR
jgi:hypothetical protein